MTQQHTSSEELYRSLVEACPDAVILLDLQGRMLYASPQAYSLFGLTSDDPLTGKSVLEWVIAEDRERLTSNLKSLLTTGSQRGTQYTLQRSDGTRVAVEVSAAVVGQEGHEASTLMAVMRDFTDRQQAQDAQREGEARFRAAFDRAPIGMVIGNADGMIDQVNQTLCRMTGYGAEEMVGHHVQEFQHPEDRHLGEDLILQLLSGEIPSFAVTRRYVAQDGRVFWARATTTAMRHPEGNLAFVLGIVDDITESKRMQEALQQSLEQLQTICDGIVEGLVITDLETRRFVRVNQSLCRMLGYSEAELLNLTLRDIHPPEAVPEDTRRFEAAAAGHAAMNESRPVLRKNGSIFYADISGHRIVYEGRPSLLALFRDVTQREQSQEALRQDRRTLRHMLQASDYERQAIAYEIHDGLTQDLAAAIMQFEAFDHLSAKKTASASTAYQEGRQLLRKAYREARRLISGVRPPILDESGLVAALEHLIHDQQKVIGPRIEFSSRVSFTRLPRILENSVYRIAQEALTNACRHSGSTRIRISLTQVESQLHLEVEDWGRGFDPGTVAEDRFGLEGIHERTRLLGGHVKIDSQSGAGCRIHVTLPILDRGPGGWS